MFYFSMLIAGYFKQILRKNSDPHQIPELYTATGALIVG